MPSYVLCKANTTSDKRSGYRVIKLEGKRKINLARILVTSIYGHQDMIDYLATYKTQDKMHGVHYHPAGALCWFECNRYGDPTGSVYYIRRIPDMKLLNKTYKERGYKKLLSQQKKKLSIKEILTKERADTEQWPICKPRLYQ